MAKLTKHQEAVLQSAAKRIADHAATKRRELCDFIGDIQKFAFSTLVEVINEQSVPIEAQDVEGQKA